MLEVLSLFRMYAVTATLFLIVYSEWNTLSKKKTDLFGIWGLLILLVAFESPSILVGVLVIIVGKIRQLKFAYLLGVSSLPVYLLYYYNRWVWDRPHQPIIFTCVGAVLFVVGLYLYRSSKKRRGPPDLSSSRPLIP